MRFLLFFISTVFAFIFYVFYTSSIGLNIYLDTTFNILEIVTLSGNLLYEVFLFLFTGIIFFLFFTDKKKMNTENKEKYLLIFLNIIYFIVFFYLFFIEFDFLNKLELVIIILFLLSIAVFNIISNLKIYNTQKLNLRYFSIIINYLSCILLITSFYFYGFNLIFLLIFFYNIIFNFYIHKLFTNYISLFFSIILSLYLIYFLFLEIYNFIILYI